MGERQLRPTRLPGGPVIGSPGANYTGGPIALDPSRGSKSCRCVRWIPVHFHLTRLISITTHEYAKQGNMFLCLSLWFSKHSKIGIPRKEEVIKHFTRNENAKKP